MHFPALIIIAYLGMTSLANTLAKRAATADEILTGHTMALLSADSAVDAWDENQDVSALTGSLSNTALQLYAWGRDLPALGELNIDQAMELKQKGQVVQLSAQQLQGKLDAHNARFAAAGQCAQIMAAVVEIRDNMRENLRLVTNIIPQDTDVYPPGAIDRFWKSVNDINNGFDSSVDKLSKCGPASHASVGMPPASSVPMPPASMASVETPLPTPVAEATAVPTSDNGTITATFSSCTSNVDSLYIATPTTNQTYPSITAVRVSGANVVGISACVGLLSALAIAAGSWFV